MSGRSSLQPGTLEPGVSSTVPGCMGTLSISWLEITILGCTPHFCYLWDEGAVLSSDGAG